MSQPQPLTIARLRANRRNGHLSRGPKTVEGRRRANLNRRQLQLPQAAHDILKRLDAQPADFYRVWRDLLAVFWFLDRSMEPYIGAVAWDSWLKQQHARRGSGQHVLRAIDARLEESLWDLVNAYALLNRKWRVNLEREIGSSGGLGTWHLRLAVESRLPAYQKLHAEGKLPQISRLEAELGELAATLNELEMVL